MNIVSQRLLTDAPARKEVGFRTPSENRSTAKMKRKMNINRIKVQHGRTDKQKNRFGLPKPIRLPYF